MKKNQSAANTALAREARALAPYAIVVRHALTQKAPRRRLILAGVVALEEVERLLMRNEMLRDRAAARLLGATRRWCTRVGAPVPSSATASALDSKAMQRLFAKQFDEFWDYTLCVADLARLASPRAPARAILEMLPKILLRSAELRVKLTYHTQKVSLARLRALETDIAVPVILAASKRKIRRPRTPGTRPAKKQ